MVASGDGERVAVGEVAPLGAGEAVPPVGRVASGEAVPWSGAAARVRVSPERASVPISAAVAAMAAPAVSSTAGRTRLRRGAVGELPAVGSSSGPSDALHVRDAGPPGRCRIRGSRGSVGPAPGGPGGNGGPVADDGGPSA
ncbi:hypothetical protein NCG97_26565 [Streptomyces lydicamycinicus]|nr:hypothetical protein [Streptomyces lydicamycinicus]USA03380.1 hypothetical protein NCG97_26565 [Streptomyces lydicamycinicus]